MAKEEIGGKFTPVPGLTPATQEEIQVEAIRNAYTVMIKHLILAVAEARGQAFVPEFEQRCQDLLAKSSPGMRHEVREAAANHISLMCSGINVTR